MYRDVSVSVLHIFQSTCVNFRNKLNDTYDFLWVGLQTPPRWLQDQTGLYFSVQHRDELAAPEGNQVGMLMWHTIRNAYQPATCCLIRVGQGAGGRQGERHPFLAEGKSDDVAVEVAVQVCVAEEVKLW